MTRKIDDSPPKIRRSRNGCNECRRIHRRCDEQKPNCGTCSNEGKKCSYERSLDWVGGSTKKKTRLCQKEPYNGHAHAFDAGESVLLPGMSRTLDWLPWLSRRHKHLIAHFANVTCSISFLDTTSHHNLCSSILPLALNSTYSFHLTAAMICLAMTHQKALGLDVDEAEAGYWHETAVGHLHRQLVYEDETSENVFAATALLLCMREIFTVGDTWRMHLTGALAVLNRRREEWESDARICLRSLASDMQRSTRIFGLKTGIVREKCSLMEAEKHQEPCANPFGFSNTALHVLSDIDAITADMTSLLHIERSSLSGSEGMESLWDALGERIEAIVEQSHISSLQLAEMELETQTLLDNSNSSPLSEQEELTLLNQAYIHITISQIQLQLLGIESYHKSVQEHLIKAMKCLQAIRLRDHASPAMALLQPVFIIGCYALSLDLRLQVTQTLNKLKQKQGRANASRALDLLNELWQRQEEDGGSSSSPGKAQILDRRKCLRVSHRGSEHEWTDLVAEKGWDLCLW